MTQFSPVEPCVGLIHYQSWQVLLLFAQVLDHDSYAQIVSFIFCLTFFILIDLWHCGIISKIKVLLLKIKVYMKNIALFTHWGKA